MERDQPFVSVIVPVWNGSSCIADCLRSLEAQSYPKARYEIIVVDNGSTDSTRDIVGGFESVILMHESQPGSYAARNLGLSRARGSYVALTDADCRADPNWLRNGMEAAFQNANAGVLAGQIRLETDNMPGSGACTAFEEIFSFNQEKNISNGGSVTANWFSPTALLREFGGFRADLKSGGDFELARRLAAAGHPIVFAREAVVYHPARATYFQLAAKARRVIGGQMARGDKGRGFGWLWRAIKTNGSRLRTIWRAADRTLVMKLRLSLLVLGLLGATLLEVLLVALGAEPKRA